MKNLVIIIPLLFGCATAKFITGPNGQPAYYISCNGGLSIIKCYKKATKVCPVGYNILDKTLTQGQAMYVPAVGMYPGGVIPGNVQQGILIQCKESL